jgi:hypothetical protein
VNRYDCLESVLGSDHRPVIMDLGINIKELAYMDSKQLMNMPFAKKQQCGIISFSSIKLKRKLTYESLTLSIDINIPTIESHLKKKLTFPSHF